MSVLLVHHSCNYVLNSIKSSYKAMIKIRDKYVVYFKAQPIVPKHSVQSTINIFDFQSKMASVEVRAIQLDIPIAEAYSLESVGKHGFGKCVCVHLLQS